MNLVSLDIESIQLGHPLPFVLRGSDGVLLAQKGYVIRTREELATMVARGRQLCVDTDESGGSHRAYLAQLQRMLMADTNLGEIAAMKMTAAEDPGNRGRGTRALPDWPELQLRATQVLRAPSPTDFGGRFQSLHDELARHCEHTPDATLLGLVYLSTQEKQMYSATHAMLVSCVCMVVAREMLQWPAARVQQLGHAALSMNI
ncbi:MAG: phosphohydrolase, partial [Comamonadaceae bacterium]